MLVTLNLNAQTTDSDIIHAPDTDSSMIQIYPGYMIDTMGYKLIFQNKVLQICYAEDTCTHYSYNPNLLLDYFDPKYSDNIDILYDLFKQYYGKEHIIIGPTNKLFSRFRVDAIYNGKLQLKNLIIVVNLAEKEISPEDVIRLFTNKKFPRFVKEIKRKIKCPKTKSLKNLKFKNPENLYRYSMPMFNSVFW